MASVSVHLGVLAIAKDPALPDLAAIEVVAERAAATGHRVIARHAVADSEAAIRSQLARWLDDREVDVVIVLSGESAVVSKALAPLVTQVIPGFTDLFRWLAFQESGASAMLSPAEAAQCGSTFVFVVPGAIAAAMDKLILPQFDPATTPRNLLDQIPRLRAKPVDAVPEVIAVEKTQGGSGLPLRLPAVVASERARPRTGANVIARGGKVPDDPATKPIDVARLERELAESAHTPHEDVTRPDLALVLPRRPPGADPADDDDDELDGDDDHTATDTVAVQPAPPLPPPASGKPRSRDDEARPRPSTAPRSGPLPSVIKPGAASPPAASRESKPFSFATPVRGAGATPAPSRSSVASPASARSAAATPPGGAPAPTPPAAASLPSAPRSGSTAPPPVATRASVWVTTPRPAPATRPPKPRDDTEPGVAVPAVAPAAPVAPAPAVTPSAPAAPARPAPSTATVPAAAAPWPHTPETLDADALGAETLDAEVAGPETLDAEPLEAEPVHTQAPVEPPARDRRPSAPPPPPQAEPPRPRLPSTPPSSAQAEPPRPRQPTPPPPAPMSFATTVEAPRTRQPTPPPPLPVRAARTPTVPPPPNVTDNDLPRGAFAYPIKPRRGNLVVKLFAAVAALVLGFFAVVYFLDRKDEPAPKLAAVSPPPPKFDAPTVDAAIEPEPELGTTEPTPVATGSAATGSAATGSAATGSAATGSAATGSAATDSAAPRLRPGTPTPRPPTGSATGSAATAPITTTTTTTTTTTATPTPPVDAAVTAPDDCDEANCVLADYDRPCCAKYKAKGPELSQRVGGVPETLDRSMVRAGVESIKPRVISCGEKSGVKGTVKIAVSVSPEGAVTSAEVQDTPDAGLGTCVAGALRSAKFGKSVEGGSFSYPFVF